MFMHRRPALLAALAGVALCAAQADAQSVSGPSKEISARNRVLERNLADARGRMNALQAEYVGLQGAIQYLQIAMQQQDPPLKLLHRGYNDLSRLNFRDPAAREKMQLLIIEFDGRMANLEPQMKSLTGRIEQWEKVLGAAAADLLRSGAVWKGTLTQSWSNAAGTVEKPVLMTVKQQSKDGFRAELNLNDGESIHLIEVALAGAGQLSCPGSQAEVLKGTAKMLDCSGQISGKEMKLAFEGRADRTRLTKGVYYLQWTK